MHIGILLAGHTPDPIRHERGDFDSMFSRLLGGNGFSFSAWDVEQGHFPDSIREADGWLISGSRHGAYEDHAFIPPLEQMIRDIYAADIPLVGICFGHQIIAQALGGRVVKFDGGWAVGRRTYDTLSGQTLALNAWHQDQVIERPDGARQLASNGFCENAMLAYGNRIFTIQPHPEFQPDLIGDYVAVRRGTGTYPDDMMDEALKAASDPVDNDRMGAAIARFFKTRDIHV